uniref:Uncharacterized protein n=1 Tax=Aegilops tauschii subsp. strangulata TaxID=200361 RepID=A0A453A387_AEGTS
MLHITRKPCSTLHAMRTIELPSCNLSLLPFPFFSWKISFFVLIIKKVKTIY